MVRKQAALQRSVPCSPRAACAEQRSAGEWPALLCVMALLSLSENWEPLAVVGEGTGADGELVEDAVVLR